MFSFMPHGIGCDVVVLLMRYFQFFSHTTALEVLWWLALRQFSISDQSKNEGHTSTGTEPFRNCFRFGEEPLWIAHILKHDINLQVCCWDRKPFAAFKCRFCIWMRFHKKYVMICFLVSLRTPPSIGEKEWMLVHRSEVQKKTQAPAS